jgi:TRAP-type C4-dicarboxylate transport system substrate-binding protein
MLKSILAAALGATALVTGAQAAETTLRFATINLPQAHLNVRILHPWAEAVNAAGKGEIQLEVRDGMTMANPVNYYERVESDVVQVAFGVQNTIVDKLKLSQVVSLPGVVTKSEEASTAYWRMYARGDFKDDYKDIHPFSLTIFPPSGIHFANEIKDLDSIKGKKLIAGSPPIVALATSLGATPLSIPLADTYEALQRGTADGTVMMYTAFQPFKLGEVTNYHVETSFGGAGSMIFMMKSKYDGLSAAARKILDDQSGEPLSRKFGRMWDDVEAEGRAALDPQKHKFIKLTADQQANFDKLAAQTADDWAKSTPGGAKVLADFRAEIEKVRAGK